jgi:D-aminopeptidase
MSSTPGGVPLSLARLAEVYLEHVDHEEALLEAMLDGLRSVRAALLSGDQAALAQALRQTEGLRASRRERVLRRHEAGAAL